MCKKQDAYKITGATPLYTSRTPQKVGEKKIGKQPTIDSSLKSIHSTSQNQQHIISHSTIGIGKKHFANPTEMSTSQLGWNKGLQDFEVTVITKRILANLSNLNQ